MNVMLKAVSAIKNLYVTWGCQMIYGFILENEVATSELMTFLAL